METACIIETSNPFEKTSHVKHLTEAGQTIRQWLKKRHGSDFVEFSVPTVIVRNGEPVLRKDWDAQLIECGDVLNIITIPQGIETLIIVAIVLVAVTMALVITAPVPATPGETPGSDPVFSTKGQQNEIRLGEPIEVCYGRNRIYPSLAARPYFQYVDNDQFQYALYCLGQGEFEIEAMQIGDSDISGFEEVQYEIIPPGYPVTLFPYNVYTSSEAGGQTLFGPNEDEYSDPGWVGPFSSNPAGTTTNKIQLDFVFPKGIYALDDDGSLSAKYIDVEMEARAIDDDGNPLGSFETLILPSPKTFGGATTTPQRKTISADVAEGRYEVRVRRTSATDLSTRAGNDVVWDGLRTYINLPEGGPDIGDKTRIAVIIRATNNLNANTQLKFNVIATRKLPIYNSSEGWSDPVPTRSIAWAFADVFRARYGGRVPDLYLNLDELIELDALYEARNEHFDWIFRDPITVWSAAQAVATVGRGVPIVSGSVITIKRDGPAFLPVTMFTPDNILSGSFTQKVQLWKEDEYDSISVEYTEPATGYLQENVLVTLPGGTTDHPQDVRIPGIQDRAHAYRDGMYMLAQQRYLRENYQFDTGLEGSIPTFGDLIIISHDQPQWGQNGIVVHAEQLSTGDRLLWLSEPLKWNESSEYQMILRGRMAEVLGPYTVVPTDDPKQVVLMSGDDDIDFQLGGGTEPMLFVFGIANEEAQLARVTSVEPQGGEGIRISAVNDAPDIYTIADGATLPEWTPVLPPIIPAAPLVEDLFLTQIDAPSLEVQAAWVSAEGARLYVVEISTDGDNWTPAGNTTATSMALFPSLGPIYVRVAGVNNGQGPWATTSISVKPLVALVLTEPWTALDWTVTWRAVSGAEGYELSLYDNTDPSLPALISVHELTTELEYQYIYDADASDVITTRSLLVTVAPIFAGVPYNDPAELTFENSIPAAPINLTFESPTVDSANAYWPVTWDNPHVDDLSRVKVWMSFEDGFDVNSTVPVFDYTAPAPGWIDFPNETTFTLPLDSNTTSPQTFYRVAVFDVFGNEIATNLSAQAEIPANWFG